MWDFEIKLIMIDESLHNISCCLHICKVHKYINLWFATRIIVILLSIFDRLELFAYTIVFVYIYTSSSKISMLIYVWYNLKIQNYWKYYY